jgi:hypothetical protein
MDHIPVEIAGKILGISISVVESLSKTTLRG